MQQVLCSKVSYSSEQFAKADLKRIESKNRKCNFTKKFPIRTYKCDKCNTWHLTSLSDKKDQEIVRLTQLKIKLNKELSLLEKSSKDAILEICIKYDALKTEFNNLTEKYNQLINMNHESKFK